MLLFQGSHGRHFKQQLTLPRLRSFTMADQVLATLNTKIDKAEAYRDDLRKRIAQSEQDEQKTLQQELVGVQNELSALQVHLNNLMEKQGEKLSSRSASSLVAPCKPRGPLTNSWELPKGRPAEGGLQSPVLRVPEPDLQI